MKSYFFILSIALFSVYSCSKLKDKNIGNDQVCNNYPSAFANNKIANGCNDLSKNILGANSTVYISTGCTGTVVAPHFVITASHCLYFRENFIEVQPSQVKIIFGDNGYDVLNIKMANAKNLFVNNMYKNDPNKSSLGDIALIQTEENLIEKFGVTPIKIAMNNPLNTDKILSIGYGQTGKHDIYSAGLKRWTISQVGNLNFDKTKTRIINNISYNIYDLFLDNVKQNRSLGNISVNYAPEETLIVTKKVESSEGQTCYGDSGGPQFIVRNGEALLISATQGTSLFWQGPDYIIDPKTDDCNLGVTSLNTRIAPYMEWLNKKMSSANESLVQVAN